MWPDPCALLPLLAPSRASVTGKFRGYDGRFSVAQAVLTRGRETRRSAGEGKDIYQYAIGAVAEKFRCGGHQATLCSAVRYLLSLLHAAAPGKGLKFGHHHCRRVRW